MTDITALRQQHADIEELIKVLSVLIKEESLCATRVVNDLHDQLTTLVHDHLMARDKTFSTFLNHEDEQIRKSVSDFLSGAQMIHKISNDYKRRWRNSADRCNKHPDFSKEALEYFDFLEKRIHEDESKCIALLERVSL